jgi:hypothetical protein
LYQSSFTVAQFNAITASTYTFGDILVLGDTASSMATHVTSLAPTYNHANTFDMVESGSDWLIKVWTEDSSIRFQNKQPLAPQ